jgi:hypothetical protein
MKLKVRIILVTAAQYPVLYDNWVILALCNIYSPSIAALLQSLRRVALVIDAKLLDCSEKTSIIYLADVERSGKKVG